MKKIIVMLLGLMLISGVTFAGPSCVKVFNNKSVTAGSYAETLAYRLGKDVPVVSGSSTSFMYTDGMFSVQPVVTAGTFTLTVYWSNDGTNWDGGTTIASGITSSNDGETYPLSPNGPHAYMKIKTTETTNTTVTGEVGATGDGATTSFSYTLAHDNVTTSSLTVHYTIGATAYTATDDGAGNISGTDCSGTINYATGAVSLTFTTAPDNATNITNDYTFSISPVITLSLCAD